MKKKNQIYIFLNFQELIKDLDKILLKGITHCDQVSY